MSTLEDMFGDEEVKVASVPAKKEVKQKNVASVKELINTDYKDYAMYVLEHRAIPSVIDGFKTVQRKLFYAMLKNGNKKIKCAEIAGTLASYGYAHGETSAQDAIVGMAQSWNNNIPVFSPHGNFGTRLIQKAAASRYIYVSPNSLVERIFSDEDVLVENKDPDDCEAHHYLPSIPWVLLNGTEGVAVGFACRYLPRAPSDLIKACKEYISTGSVKNDLTPSFPGFTGSIKKIEDGKFSTIGVIEKGLRNSYIIKDLPWTFDREKYFSILVEMQESKKISSFEDHCDKSGFNFIVKLDPEQRESAEKDLIKYFKLAKIHTENYTSLDEFGKLKIFNHVNEIIAYFCDYRIKKKKQQLDFDIGKIQSEIDFLKAKELFIRSVIDVGVAEVSKWKSEKFKQWIKDLVQKEDYVSSLSRTPIYSFTQDEIDSLDQEILKKESMKSEISLLEPEKVLIADMNSLKL